MVVRTAAGVRVAAGTRGAVSRLAAGARVGTGPVLTGQYGSRVVFDGVANCCIGKAWLERPAMTFIAPVTSTILSVRWPKKGGTASYGKGTGGDIRVSIQTVDGSHKPTGTILASVTHAAIGNTTDAADRGTLSTFASPPAVTAGTQYAIVFDNVDAAPADNYVSVNLRGIMGGSAPWADARDPLFPTATDCEVWIDPGDGNGWVESYSYYPLSPIFDLAFGNGLHHGVGYTLADVDCTASITDTAWVCQSMMVPGGVPRRVTDAYIRLRRTSGTDPLTVTIESPRGTVIATATVAAASIAIGAAYPAATASTWAHAAFPAAVILAPGVPYFVVLKGTSGTTYTLVAMWKGIATSYSALTYFAVGKAEVTANSGGTWADVSVGNTCDLQFYVEG